MSTMINCHARKSNQPQCKIQKQSGLVTVKDKHGDNAALRVRELLPVLHKMLGPPTLVVKANGRGVSRSKFQGKQGIIVFDTTGAWNDATGHMTVLMKNGMLIEKHLSASKVNEYFKISVKVSFWETN